MYVDLFTAMMGGFLFVGVFLIWIYLIHVKIVKQRNYVLEALSSVDVQLKKRHDLVPNLVATAKGYMKHEKDLLEEITKLRSIVSNSSAVDATKSSKSDMTTAMYLGVESMLGSKIATLLARVEDYPELKASENMLHIQRSLNELEAMISAARRFYNSAVGDWNDLVQIFPRSIIASMMGAGPLKFFEAQVSEKDVVQISTLLK